jgi:hypothetical protein
VINRQSARVPRALHVTFVIGSAGSVAAWDQCVGRHLNPAYVAAHPHNHNFASKVLDDLGGRLVQLGSMNGDFDELMCQNERLEIEGRCPHKDALGWCGALRAR